ncbi:SDR family NAD(P)-dependent oxidoreductase [Actinokineospora sp. HUAS TT18]|uniref:SDR family NAD(P)-dependent oxidoreductase n=1 Tax=Actinokineospora sp. HUAS TT18 TaxID=3447451 RepID=UPI003F526171
MNRFTGKTALVTGGASGIGAATARRLAAEGASVVVTDIDGDGGAAVAAEVGGRYLHLDATSEADWARVADLGELDVLHLNVGHKPPKTPPHELAVEAWDAVQHMTLRSAFLGVRATVPLLRPRSGCVVVTGSIHALVGMPGATAYAAAKGGLDAMVRQLAAEYGPDIRVNAVHPGPIRTPSWGEWTGAEHIARTLAKRAGTPEDVAAAVAFLASADAAYVTGAALPVDGGWHANGL